MKARCSTCAIDYPDSESRCHVCEHSLDRMSDGEPQTDWKEAVERTKAGASAPRTTIEQVDRWRLEQLLRAGYPVEIAEAIATRHEIDLHNAVDLAAERGCPHELAGAILL